MALISSRMFLSVSKQFFPFLPLILVDIWRHLIQDLVANGRHPESKDKGVAYTLGVEINLSTNTKHTLYSTVTFSNLFWTDLSSYSVLAFA